MRERIAGSAAPPVCCVTVLMLAPLVVSMAQAPVASRAASESCSYGSWSPPTWLETPRPPMTSLQFRALAVSAGSTVTENREVAYTVGVAGFLHLTLPRDNLPATEPITWPPRMRVIRSDGATFDGPRGNFWFAYPRAAVDDAGTLHVVWGETERPVPADPRRLIGQAPTIRSVWYATLQSGQWSRPVRIYRGTSLEWEELKTSRLVRDRDNGLSVAFSVSDSAPGIVVLYAPNAPERRWRSTRIPHQSPAGYIDLATGPDQEAAIIFTAGVALPEQRINVVFLTQSRDGGRTWSNTAQVSGPTEEPAFEPHVFVDRRSAVRMVWVQQGTGSFAGGRLWHVILVDSTRQSARDLALPAKMMTSHSEAVIDECDTIHLFTLAYPKFDPDLRYARATPDGWTPWMRPFDQPGGRVSIAASRDAVHLTFSSHAPASVQKAGEVSGIAYSTLRYSPHR